MTHSFFKIIHRHSHLFVFIIFLILLILKSPRVELYFRHPDLGLAMGAAKQTLLGFHQPFIDMFMVFGPLTVYTMTLALWIHDAPISTNILFSLGWAISLFIYFRLLKRYIPSILAFFIALFFLYYISNFYRWYYCLFYLSWLVIHIKITQSNRPNLWILLLGFSGGTSMLFRVDMTFLCLGFAFFNFLFLDSNSARIANYLKRVSIFLGSFSIPICCWLLILNIQGGDISLYFLDQFEHYQGYAKRVLTLTNPSMHMIELGEIYLLYSYPLITLLGFSLGIYFLYKKIFNSNEYREILALSSFSLAMTTLYMYESSASHFIPQIPIVTLIIIHLIRFIRNTPLHYKTIYITGMTLVLVCISIGWYKALDNGAGTMMTSLSKNPTFKFKRLALKNMEGCKEYHYAKMIKLIQDQTPQNESIFTIEYSPIHYYSNRPMAGMTLARYPTGLNIIPSWQKRFNDALKADPPYTVIVPIDFYDLSTHDYLLEKESDLYHFIKKHYTKEIHRVHNLIVLQRNPLDSEKI